jgi:hypothetical protein
VGGHRVGGAVSQRRIGVAQPAAVASWLTRNARLLRLAPDLAISAPSIALGSSFAWPDWGMTSTSRPALMADYPR